MSWLRRGSNPRGRNGAVAVTESPGEPGREAGRYPLSFTQEWFLTLDQGDAGGAFGETFILAYPVRVTGPVDAGVLQGALDDVVARHELLRTVVVRDADPPYQQVLGPCPVPLEVQDVPAAAGAAREAVIQELAHRNDTLSAREVPLLRARLCRFDDRDSVLFVTAHHSACDAWSMEVIMRDLGAFYTARAAGVRAQLPPVRQYREYAAWQRAAAASSAGDGAPAYWRDKLAGAREFTIPNDHGHPAAYSRPYSLHTHAIDADVVAAAAALARACRTTLFSVLLSAIYVLAHQITGATDLTIRAFTAGRGEQQFQDTMGLFMNLVPFRTCLDGAASFRDIVARARDTFFDAVASELPVGVIEQAFPDFTRSREDPGTSQFIISCHESPLGEDRVFPIAGGAREIEIRSREEDEQRDIPSGMVWNLDLPRSRTLSGSLLFNLDEFDKTTVAGWAADLSRILTSAVTDPDQDWKAL